MKATALLAACCCVAALAGCGGGSTTRSAVSVTKQARTTPQPGPTTWHGPLLTGGAARSAPVPILMYHVVSQAKPGVPYPDLWVSKENFANEIVALKAAGFQGVTLAEVWNAWHHGAKLPAKPIVVSFDDGYLSHFTHAAPVLKRAGWPGVLNLVWHNLGPKGIPNWMVGRLIRNGWELDSHTIDHLDMPTLTASQMQHQLTGSKQLIEKTFGVVPMFFTYPAGKFDATVEQAVKAAGYLGATTEIPGWAKPGGDPYAMPRVRVNGSDTAASVLEKVRAQAPQQQSQ